MQSQVENEEPKIEDVPATDAPTTSFEDAGEIIEPGVRQMDNGTVIIRDKSKISSFYDQYNVLRGFKSAAQQMEESEPNPDSNAREIKIPLETFDEFETLREDNEDLFKYVITHILMEYVKEQLLKPFELTNEAQAVDEAKIKEALKVCLVFPDNIPSEGRPLIHDIASSFKLAHHSGGQKKSRKVFVYPKTLYMEKQQQEKRRLEKERRKLYEKFKSREIFRDIPQTTATTFTDKVIRDIWEERILELPENERSNLGQRILDNIEQSCGTPPDPVELRVVLDQKQKEMNELLKKITATIEKLDERNDKLIKLEDERKEAQAKRKQEKKAANEARRQRGEDSETDSEEEKEEQEEELDEETLERIKQNREANAKLIRDFEEKMETTNLQTFNDKPDAVEKVYMLTVGDEWAEMSWDAPDSNNSPITGYNVYVHESYQAPYNSVDLSTKVFEWEGATPQGGWIKIGSTKECEFQAQGFEPLAAYQVMVRAENEVGEGYMPKQPSLLLTLSKRANNPCDLYVWGSNTYSELGLNEEQVALNKEAYFSNTKKAMMHRPVLQDSFKGNVYQAAASSGTTTVSICHGDGMTVVQMGAADILKEEYEEDQKISEKTQFDLQDGLKYIERIPAMPFGINFRISVAKVAAGAGFTSLLSVEGDVYTWGSNQFGELGIDKTGVSLQLRPGDPLKFITHKEMAFPDKQRKHLSIIDIVCGDSFAMALSSTREVFVWGRRMGIYPKVELNHAYLMRFQSAFLTEINQACPRQVTNNINFYKIQKLFAGPMNAGLISEEGDLLLQGFNNYNQILLSTSTYDRERISEGLMFMPEFMKIDFFKDFLVKQVAISNSTIHTLCEHKGSGKQKIFGWGSNENQLLGPCEQPSANEVPTTRLLEPKDLTKMFFPEEQETILEGESEQLDVIFDDQKIRSIVSGQFHTLVLDKTQKIQGIGQTNRGQLGKKVRKEQTSVGEPCEVTISCGKDQTVQEIICGGQYTLALVGKGEQ